MNKALTVIEYATEFAQTEQCRLLYEKARNSYPEYWAKKSTLDYAMWNLGAHRQKDAYEQELFFLTDTDWHPSLIVGTSMYVHGTLYKCDSNLDLYTICLAGNDDFSISKDFIGYDVAITAWLDLCAEQYVREEHLPGNYFSN